MNRFLKLLLASACVAVIGYVGLSVYAYYAWRARLQDMAAQEVELAPLREKCSNAKALLVYYATPKARQKPDMMSWDDARRFVERNCSDAKTRYPKPLSAADRRPFWPF